LRIFRQIQETKAFEARAIIVEGEEMADPASTDLIQSLGNIVAAIAALGTASMGFVDALKAFDGGPSNFGFSSIKRTLGPFLPKKANGAFNEADLLEALKSNWINGVAKADQKAKAKALVHLGLTAGNAVELAQAAGVDEKTLASVANKVAGRVQGNTALTPAEINTLGQFDAILSAILDEAYERADQQYRNGTKILAMIFAVVFGIAGSCLINGSNWKAAGLGLLVGLVAVPLAPVAKDLVSSLQAAVAALQATQRGVRR
jgi:hypothetical protein